MQPNHGRAPFSSTWTAQPRPSPSPSTRTSRAQPQPSLSRSAWTAASCGRASSPIRLNRAQPRPSFLFHLTRGCRSALPSTGLGSDTRRPLPHPPGSRAADSGTACTARSSQPFPVQPAGVARPKQPLACKSAEHRAGRRLIPPSPGRVRAFHVKQGASTPHSTAVRLISATNASTSASVVSKAVIQRITCAEGSHT